MSIFVIMNDYFHDVATASLLASAVILLVLERKACAGGPERRAAFGRAFLELRKYALFIAAWIVVGGIPRVLYWERFEWAQAVANDIVPALYAKHVLQVLAIMAGAVLWVGLGRRAAALRAAADSGEGAGA